MDEYPHDKMLQVAHNVGAAHASIELAMLSLKYGCTDDANEYLNSAIQYLTSMPWHKQAVSV